MISVYSSMLKIVHYVILETILQERFWGLCSSSCSPLLIVGYIYVASNVSTKNTEVATETACYIAVSTVHNTNQLECTF